MLAPGQQLTLDIEKPAAGGRMIARHEGRIILVADAIPGERIVATVTKVAKGVAFADTIRVESPSPDRRATMTDTACGGTAFAHIDYNRQLTIKGEIIADGLARIGRVTLPAPVAVVGSRPDGYRMRARLHADGGRLGFFREGTHQLCDPRATGQLLPATCDVIEAVAAALDRVGAAGLRAVEVSENVDATQRAFHFEWATSISAADLKAALDHPGVTGVLLTAPARSGLAPETLLVSGDPYVIDRLTIDAVTVSFRRHVQSFFQGNRYLLPDLVADVVAQLPAGERMIDLYAGVGLFAVSAAASRGKAVVAVESDAHAARDLEVNASHLPANGGRVEVVHRSVERHLAGGGKTADAVILDPPRTGMSPDALRGLLAVGAPRVIYVSCDVATLGRDVRALVAAGYGVTRVQGFDLFPNTAHVETVLTLDRG